MAKTIIIIEDDQTTRKIYLDRFKMEGFNVLTTPTGEEGLEYIKQKKPDIILLDILLSGKIDGITVLKKLREESSNRNIPVLLLSNVELEKAETKKMGADDYLVKAEIDIDELVKKVKEMMDK